MYSPPSLRSYLHVCTCIMYMSGHLGTYLMRADGFLPREVRLRLPFDISAPPATTCGHNLCSVHVHQGRSKGGSPSNREMAFILAMLFNTNFFFLDCTLPDHCRQMSKIEHGHPWLDCHTATLPHCHTASWVRLVERASPGRVRHG